MTNEKEAELDPLSDDAYDISTEAHYCYLRDLGEDGRFNLGISRAAYKRFRKRWRADKARKRRMMEVIKRDE